jgi:hypothetical protein
MAAYGIIIPKKTRKSSAPTPIHGIKTSKKTAKPEKTMLIMKFMNDYLASKTLYF